MVLHSAMWKVCGTAVVPQVPTLAYRIMEPARAVRAGSGWESPPTTLSYTGFESWAARALSTATPRPQGRAMGGAVSQGEGGRLQTPR
ncbi:hypothetical protein CLOP_g18536 [Closterium sp. NIES-67]|nr:hypothetical protein CLOP_g18536 [Closterium sp. NIES-67]